MVDWVIGEVLLYGGELILDVLDEEGICVFVIFYGGVIK